MFSPVLSRSMQFKPETRTAPTLASECVDDDRLTFEFVTDLIGLMTLQSEWDELFERHGRAHQCFQSHAWSRHWCSYYVGTGTWGPEQIAVVIARRHGRVVLICPLAVYRRAGLMTLRWMGAPVGQYGDVLVADVSDREALIGRALAFAVAQTGADIFNLQKVRADAQVAPVLQSQGASAINETSAPYIDLSAASCYDDYAKRFSRNGRKQRLRRRRRLAAHVPLRLLHLEPGRDAAREVAITIEEKLEQLQREAAIPVAIADPNFRAFFRSIATSSDPAISCSVSLLVSGDKVIAREVGLTCHGGYLAHIGTYDPTYRSYSPGILLIDDMIAHCCAQGISRYDLLPPSASYKTAIADGEVAVCDYVHPLTVAGAVYANSVVKVAVPALRNIKNAVPAMRGALSRAGVLW